MASREYQMAFSIGAKLQSQFSGAFKSAQASVTALQNEVQSLNKQQGDITAYQKQQKAVEQTKAKLQVLQQQYANLKASIGESGEASVDLKNKMLAKELQIERTTQRLEGQEAQLQATGNALNEAGIDTQNLTSASNQLEAEISNLKGQQEELAAATDETGQYMSGAADSMMELIGALGLAEALKTGYEAMKACTEEAIAFENSMAAVKRTVGGDDAFLSDLGASFKELSTVIPISTVELTEIATTAGQLGIAQGDVEQFTTVMAKLATTTDLTANDAATMLAQFANITGLKDYDRLGSVIAELGDATATTASKVVQMSQGMAASASQAGMTSTDIMAISAALGSLGIEAQAGATSMSQLISTLYKATETGEGLKDFASVAGMSAEQFKQAWATDAVGAMNAFIQGLNDTERNGKSAIVILDELGITNVRQTKAILGLASAGDLLSRTISQANSAWSSNTALNEKAAIMYTTTQSKLLMLQNTYSNLQIAVGDAFTPIVSAAAAALTDMIKPVTAFIEQNPALVRAAAAAAAVIGTVTVALTAYTAATKLAAAASAMLTTALGGPAMKIIMGATLAAAGLAAGITLLWDAFGSGSQTMEQLDAEFDGLNTQIQDQQKIIDLCERYKQLQKELGHTSESMQELEGLNNITIQLDATADPTLEPVDFMKENGEGITLTAGQTATLLSAGFLKEDDPGIELTAEQTTALYKKDFFLDADEDILLQAQQIADQYEAGFLAADDPGIMLEAGQVNKLLAMGFMDPEDKGITLTAAQTNTLIAEGFLDPEKKIITLTATQKKTLVAKGFLLPGENSLSISATEVKSLEAKNFLKGSDVITLNGKPDTKITVDDFISVSDRLVHLSADIENLPALQASVADLQNKAASAKADFSTASADLAAMNERYGELQARYNHAGSKTDKSAIQAEMEVLSGVIDEQETKVEKLETAYTHVNAELLMTSTAAGQLQAKEAELAAVKEQLAAASDGVITASAGETAAFNEQVESLEAVTKAQQAGARAKLYENVSKSAQEYAKALQQSNEYTAAMAPYLKQAEAAEKYLGMTADEVNVKYQSLLTKLNEMQTMEGFNPFDADFLSKINEVNTLASLMGHSFDGLAEYADQGIDWSDAFGWIGTNAYTWTHNLEDMNEQIAMYGDAVGETNGKQRTFIDNLVSGIQAGSVSLEEVEALLKNTFASYENGAEIVDGCMAEIVKALGIGTESSEEFAGGLESAAASAAQVNAAIGPILSQMDQLAEAYTKAYDAAYSSMDGQFNLFENVDRIMGKTGDDGKAAMESMIEAMQQQQQYMTDYAANLEAVKKMGLAEGLVSKLSDGSTESAQILADIAASGSTYIDELNTAFAGMEEGKATFADTVAEMETEFSSQMAALQAELETTVSEMDMSSDAAAAGAATVQAFADAASGKLAAVQFAFAAVAATAKAAMNISGSLPGHAAGTDNAERGFALVGEEGPELMWFNGGETVYNAQETQRMLNAQPANAINTSVTPAAPSLANSIIVKPEFVINGSADTAEIEAMINRATDNMKTVILDALEEAEADRERSVYSR